MNDRLSRFLQAFGGRLRNFRPFENSFVDEPANRRPFCVIKAAGGESQMEFTEEQVELLKAAGLDVAKLAEMPADEQEKVIADLEKAASDGAGDDGDGIKEKLLALVARCVGAVTAAKAVENEPDPDDDDKDEPKEDPRVAKLEEANAELRERLDESEKEAVVEKAVGVLDTAPITPATRDALRPFVAYLAGAEGAVIVQKDEKGVETEVSMAEHLVEVVTEREESLQGLMDEMGGTGRIEGAADAWQGYERRGVTQPDNGSGDE